MPLKKDSNGGGTNADGSISEMYCSHCYENGEFTRQNITAHEMQEIVIDKMKSMGFPKFLAKFFTKGIPNLERWNN
jgi:hypothetical protein